MLTTQPRASAVKVTRRRIEGIKTPPSPLELRGDRNAQKCGESRRGATRGDYDRRMLTLYQAEWCPFSSAVREVLTELGLDFVARQVEPWPEERSALKEVAG